MKSIASLSIQEPFMLEIVFTDGIRGNIDISTLFGKKKFAELQQGGLFKQVTIDNELGVPTWPNGADLCSDSYYDLFASQNKNANNK